MIKDRTIKSYGGGRVLVRQRTRSVLIQVEDKNGTAKGVWISVKGAALLGNALFDAVDATRPQRCS